jgi:hypothetical protein
LTYGRGWRLVFAIASGMPLLKPKFRKVHNEAPNQLKGEK